MSEAILFDRNYRRKIRLADDVPSKLTLEVRKKEFIQALCHFPLCSLLYATSVFFDEENNRKGARSLTKSGLLRALGIFLNSSKLFKKSIFYYEECLNNMNLYVSKCQK